MNIDKMIGDLKKELMCKLVYLEMIHVNLIFLEDSDSDFTPENIISYINEYSKNSIEFLVLKNEDDFNKVFIKIREVLSDKNIITFLSLLEKGDNSSIIYNNDLTRYSGIYFHFIDYEEDSELFKNNWNKILVELCRYSLINFTQVIKDLSGIFDDNKVVQ